LEARTEIKWEQYVKKIQIEARVLGELAMNHIVPIASRYEDILLDKVWKMSQIGMQSKSDTELIHNIQKRTSLIQKLVAEMIEARKVANVIENTRTKAIAYHDTVAVYFDKIRTEIDKLEEVVDDQIWTLPKYREILFVK
jgi:glutamine synthetase